MRYPLDNTHYNCGFSNPLQNQIIIHVVIHIMRYPLDNPHYNCGFSNPLPN